MEIMLERTKPNFFIFESGKEVELKEQFLISNAIHVNYDGDEEDWEKAGISHAGKHSYFFSLVDERNKYSLRFKNSLGIGLITRLSDDSFNISCLSHQNSDFIVENKELYIKELRRKIEELQDRSKNRNIYSTIFGGNFYHFRRNSNDEHSLAKDRVYNDYISFLHETIIRETKSKPQIISPSLEGDTNAYFNTQSNTLSLVRYRNPELLNKTYTYDAIIEEMRKWIHEPTIRLWSRRKIEHVLLELEIMHPYIKL